MDDREQRAKLLNAVMRALLAEFAPIGFKRNGRRLDRRRADLLDIISVQATRYPTPGELEFRINVEMIPIPLWEKHTAGWPKPRIGTGFRFCDLQPASFLKPYIDRWNVVRVEEEAAQAVAADVRIIKEFGVPIMDSFPDNASYIEALRNGNHRAASAYYAARLVSLWDGTDPPSLEDFPRPPTPTPDQLLADPAMRRVLEEAVAKKKSFYGRRKK
jgi:hypothetical protein